MTDRELLELAAKAVGIKVPYDEKWGGMLIPVTVEWEGDGLDFWNPLTSSGDAFDLAVRLRLSVDHNHSADQQRWVSADRSGCEGCYSPVSCVEDDFEELGRVAATRRAIVRAASEIGSTL